MSKQLMSRLKAAEETSTSSVSRRAAPRDAHGRAKAVMTATLRAKDLDAAKYWVEELNGWALPFGRAPIVVQLVRNEREDPDNKKKKIISDMLMIHTRVMRLPSSNLLALYRTVLEANDVLTGTAFAIVGEYLMLTHQRTLQDLDESELDELIGHTVMASAHFGPLLCEQFDTGAVPD